MLALVTWLSSWHRNLKPCCADLVTGEVVDKLMHHREIVRDCSWHPHEQEVRCVLSGMALLNGPQWRLLTCTSFFLRGVCGAQISSYKALNQTNLGLGCLDWPGEVGVAPCAAGLTAIISTLNASEVLARLPAAGDDVLRRVRGALGAVAAGQRR